MSFVRLIYNIFFRKFLDRTFTLNDFLHLLDLIKDVKNGRHVDTYELMELNGSEALAKHIDNKDKLLPHLKELIDDRQRGPEIRESLYQHRVLINTMFFNEQYVLKEISEIIHELYSQVRIEEERRGRQGIRVIIPQTGYEIRKI